MRRTPRFLPVFVNRGRLVSLFGAVVVAGVVGAPGAVFGAGAGFERRAVESTGSLVDAGVEVTGARSERSRTFRVARGAFVTRVYGAPVNAASGQGRFSAVPSGLATGVSELGFDGVRSSTRLPRRLNGGRVSVASGGRTVGLSFDGATAALAAVEGASATYVNARPGADVTLTGLSEGVKEELSLRNRSAPTRYEYTLDVPAGATVSVTANASVLIDAPGDVDFEVTVPFMYDARRDFAPKTAATYAVARSAVGYRLSLTLDERWLAAKGRAWPVTVDPTLRRTGVAETTDASLIESVPTIGYGGSPSIFVGRYAAFPTTDSRGVLRFDLSGVPTDARVLQARMGLQMYFKENSTAKKVGLHALTRGFTHDATWNRLNATTGWTTPGGEFDAAPAATTSIGTTLGWVSWYPTELAQEWVNGTRPNYGLLLKDVAGEPKNGTEFRASEFGTAADRPYLDVVWYPRTGDPGGYTFDDHPLDDGTVLRTNVANGNLFFERRDVAGTGPGVDFSMRRYFNSKADGAGYVGNNAFAPPVWTGSNGKFVGATVMSNGDFLYKGTSGFLLPFLKQPDGTFKSPPEFAGTLVQNTGAPWGQTYTMTLGDGTTRTFGADGTWTSQKDGANNTFTLNYPAPSYQHTSITGTNGLSTAFQYVSGSYLTNRTTNPAGDYDSYAYTSDRLTSEARNGTTRMTYGYDASGRLNRITDGEGRVTQITLDSSDRVTEIIDGPDPTDPKTTYAYSAGRTDVTDPQGRVSMYFHGADARVTSTQAPASSWATAVPTTSRVLFGDSTGDGMADLVTIASNGAIETRVSTGQGFSAPQATGSVLTSLIGAELADVDGDGDSDLVVRTLISSTVLSFRVQLSDGGQFGLAQTWYGTTTAASWLADIDGDEASDLMVRRSDGRIDSGYAVEDGFYDFGPFSPATTGTVRFASVDSEYSADLITVATDGTVRVGASDSGTVATPVVWASIPAGADVAFIDTDGDDRADMLYRDSAGKVFARRSTGSGFAAATAVGSWPSTRTFGVSDVDGDGRGDLIGRDQTSIWVSTSQGAYSTETPEPYVPTPEDDDPGEGVQATAAAVAAAAPTMPLAWGDDNSLQNALNPDRGTPNPNRAEAALDRIQQAGASWVRYTVLWNRYQTQPNYKAALLNSVDRANARGLTVYMTLTGANYDDPVSHIDPSATGFAAFVTAVVNDFKSRGVKRFAMWNEPNTKTYLEVPCPGTNIGTNRARKYRELYLAGYTAAKAAEPTARIYLGELSEQSSSGRNTCATREHPALNTIKYLEKVVEGGGVLTHGIAWHAYQHRHEPSRDNKVVGIFDTQRFQKRILSLHKSGALRTPVTNKLPGLLITEFGYFNVPYSTALSNQNAHTEVRRAALLKQALQMATKYNVKLFTFWLLGEAYTSAADAAIPFETRNALPKENRVRPQFDTGMLSPTGATLDPKGVREYGKGPAPLLANPQARKAYCAVRDWAGSKGYTRLAPNPCA